jgi:hypothetical protein
LFSNDHQYFIDHTMVLSLLLLSIKLIVDKRRYKVNV